MRRSFEVTTTRNTNNALPKVNDHIVIDGIPADVVEVHPFHGIKYQVAIPGLVVDGKQRYIVDWMPWSIVLDIHETTAS